MAPKLKPDSPTKLTSVGWPGEGGVRLARVRLAREPSCLTLKGREEMREEGGGEGGRRKAGRGGK